MVIVGFDPGITGALAILDRAGKMVVEDLPSIARPGTGMITRKLDGKAMYALLRDRIDPLEHVLCIVEDVATLGGAKAAQIQGSLQYSKAVIETVIGIAGYQAVLVNVQKWKKFYRLGKDKDESMAIARTLYPDVPLKLKKHHNRAEAVLLAHYGLRCLT